MYDSFVRYQKKIQRQFRQMQKVHGFQALNGNRPPRAIQKELQSKVESILNGKIVPVIERSVAIEHEDPIFDLKNG